jgi:hypothetical protein
MENVVVSRSVTTTFESQAPLKGLPYQDEPLGIFFDSEESYAATLSLLRFHCPDPNCNFVQDNGGWNGLKNHVNKAHQMLMCDICTSNKKIFAHEHTLYPPPLLKVHREHGDNRILNEVINPDSSFIKGHPSCDFCNIRYFGTDELFVHCRHSHEECFLCQKLGVHNIYYSNYSSLQEHYVEEHYPCVHPDCQELKFIVFASDIDLKAHEAEKHITRGVQRSLQQRRIEVDFTYTDSQERKGRNGRKGKKDWENPIVSSYEINGKDFPSSSADPLPREVRSQDERSINKGKGKSRNQPKEIAQESTSNTSPNSSKQSSPSSGLRNLTEANQNQNVSRTQSGQPRAQAPAGIPIRPGSVPIGRNTKPKTEIAPFSDLLPYLGDDEIKSQEFTNMLSALLMDQITCLEFVRSLKRVVGLPIKQGFFEKIIDLVKEDAKKLELRSIAQDLRIEAKTKTQKKVLIIRPSTPTGRENAFINESQRKPSWSYILPSNKTVRAQTAKKVKSVWNASHLASSSSSNSFVPGAAGQTKGAWGRPSSSQKLSSGFPVTDSSKQQRDLASGRSVNEREYPALPAAAKPQHFPKPTRSVTPQRMESSWAPSGEVSTDSQTNKGKKGKKNLLFRVGL